MSAGAEAAKRWRQTHPEAVKEQKRLYYLRSRERLRDQRNAKNKARAANLREKVHASFGSVCQKCGFGDWRALHIDHIRGGGRQDRAKFANHQQFLQHVLESPAGYQLLCANCNSIKRHECNEFGASRLENVED